MRSTGCEHVAAPPMPNHSPQSGECRLAVLGRSRSEGRVGEGTGFWLCGWGTAAFAPRAPVAHVGCRLELWRGRRFFFHLCRCRCRRCHYRHIHRPRHRRRPGSFSPIAHVLHPPPLPSASDLRWLTAFRFSSISFQLSTFSFSSISPSFPSSGGFRLAGPIIHFSPLSRSI